LAKISAQYPLQAAICLKLIVDKISSDRYVFLEARDVRRILNAAVDSKDLEAVAIAEATQDALVRLGRFEYKEL
jgi:hypothetical protein